MDEVDELPTAPLRWTLQDFVAHQARIWTVTAGRDEWLCHDRWLSAARGVQLCTRLVRGVSLAHEQDYRSDGQEEVHSGGGRNSGCRVVQPHGVSLRDLENFFR